MPCLKDIVIPSVLDLEIVGFVEPVAPQISTLDAEAPRVAVRVRPGFDLGSCSTASCNRFECRFVAGIEGQDVAVCRYGVVLATPVDLVHATRSRDAFRCVRVNRARHRPIHRG